MRDLISESKSYDRESKILNANNASKMYRTAMKKMNKCANSNA